MAETETDENDDIAMSDYNDDDPAMSDRESPLETSANDDIENNEVDKNSTEEVPSPLIYGRKTNDSTKVKSSKRHRPVKVTPLESPMGNPHVDKDATDKPNTYVFDPTDVQIHEFFFRGEPNPKDLEGVEEDKILEIHRTFQQKLKDRDADRERNITKKIQEYKQKYDFINKALLESVAQITEMTKPNHSTASARVKSAYKMVMLPPLFHGTKPEVAKQHYKRFNQYIKFQMKSRNIRDPIGEAIELFEHTLDKKALVWFQEHKDKFVDLTTLKTMFLQRYNPWGKTEQDQLQSWNILTFDPQKMDVDEHIDLINTLGDMLGQKEESKKDKFIDTMPTIIQTHLVTEKTWAETMKKAKELEHIIKKCDPLAAALPTLAQGTAVPGLYSHIAHSNDKDEMNISQPFKGACPKQPKPRGGGKGKQPQQKPKNPPPQTQDDQYNYEDTNNYYHNENYRGQSRGRRPYRGQNTRHFFRGQNFHGRGHRGQNTYQGQYQNDGYHSNNYQGNQGFYHNPHRNFSQGNSYRQSRGRSHGQGRGNYHGRGHGRSNYRGNANYQYHQYYGHDDEYQTDQYGPPCALCGGYNHSPKHCFKGEHNINDIMEKMNINGYQSQSSDLYS